MPQRYYVTRIRSTRNENCTPGIRSTIARPSSIAPVGWCVSRQRTIVACNRQLTEIFQPGREALIGQSFGMLYSSVARSSASASAWS